QGLFGIIAKDSSVANLSVEKSYVKGGDYVSGICGYSSSSFSNCHNAATVEGNQYISGIIGGAGNPGGLFGGSPVNLENCSNIGIVTGQNYVGGVLGNADTGVLKKCYNVGAVTGTNHVGGIAGRSVETHYCWNLGDITGADYTGGILGEAAFFGSDQSKVLNCFNAGAIKGKSYTGGIVGYAYAYSWAYKADINNCYNVGTINADGDYVAGIAGSSNRNRVNNCYNAGICVFGNSPNSDAIFNIANSSGNLFYLAGCCGDSYSNYWDTVKEMTASEMQESAFVSTLNNGGSAWLQDTENYNSGYPILSGIDYEVYARYIKQSDTSNDTIIFDNESYSINFNNILDITALIPSSKGLQENDITWSSDDESIVIINETNQVQFEEDNMYASANISAISTGTATITVTLSDGRNASCKINVNPNIIPEQATMQIGNTITVSAYGLNLQLDEQDISWSISDKSMFDVVKTDYNVNTESGSASILLKAAKTGTTTVICSIKELGSFNCEIRVELDHWSFSNAKTEKDGKWLTKDGYYITLDDYSSLISNLSIIDKMKITYDSNYSLQSRYNIDGTPSYNPLLVTYGFIDWTGSCHGMSRWVCLVNAGILSPEILLKSTLYEVDRDNRILAKKTQSAINFYHFQQTLSYYENKVAKFMSLDQNEQLKQLKTYAQKAENEKKSFLIGFEWYEKFKENGKCLTSSATAHAVVGYGLETGNWSISVNDGEEILYTNRIRIYDCARGLSDFSDCDLYFTDTGIWCIPGWNIISRDKDMNNKDNNGHLKLVTDDVSDLNYVDYLTGETSTAMAPKAATLSTAFEAANMSSTGSVTFNPNGNIIVEADKNADFYVNITVDDENYALPWYTLEITGSNSSNISTELVDDGLILASNNLVNITIYGSNDQETKKLIFSTNEESVLISEQEDELIILVDTDSDGEYETPLDQISGTSTYTITFISNGGTGSMENSTVAGGTPFTLPSCSFLPPANKIFDKWAVGSANSDITINAGSDYAFTADTTVYALWKDAPGHSHNWVTSWSNDSTHHWHECSASGCTTTSNSGKSGYGAHVYDDDADTTCNTCGYIR
ncbi:MAG: hypothetical protein K2O18_13740, partial [Oscillospiraceae bacterium]|nr:hypothetical protein [Oscillospiraceae bacterium]